MKPELVACAFLIIYRSAVGASYVSLARINGAWYAFQEQQKKIDEIVKLVHDYTPDYWLDNMIQELLK